jgi:hypothetical protein
MGGPSKRVLAAVVLLAVIAACAVWVTLRLRSGGAPPVPDKAYYFDLETGELFVDAAGKVVPFKRPSGNDAVLAHVYSCGDCGKEAERFVGYYEALSQEAIANPALRYMQASRVVSKDAGEWFPMNSPDAQRVMDVACSDGTKEALKRCPP